ncbi:MAG: T9SS type A sorting domain-containing protein [Bacteroidales bacterium]|jgi:hypothetical protein|nr:T9SS type A sorting domain-containing protein [Bacteroidales bacterium]
MISKKNYITIIFIFSCICLQAQELFDNAMSHRKINYFLPQVIASKDFNTTHEKEILMPLNKSYLKTSNGWYPKKGEFYFQSETEIAGYLYFEIGEDGFLDKKISVCNNQNLYDSTVIVMNQTPYSKGKDLYDTVYNYRKSSNDSYILDKRVIHSYHYFDHFDNDSLFYEIITQYWDGLNKQWINYHRIKFGYHDTLVQFNNRLEEYTGGEDNTWALYIYIYDSITYNDKGYVDSLYRNYNYGDGYKCISKVGFTNDEQGRYTQANYYTKKDDNWKRTRIDYDITWTEWNGFMFGREVIIGRELITPYKRTKINSYYISDIAFYQKLWDINGTLSNSDAQYQLIDGQLYILDVTGNYYNEYDDYIEWRNEYYSLPNEDEDPELIGLSAIHNKFTYDEIYGKTGYMQYIINLNDNGIIDSAFYFGEKFTDFAYYASIPEYPQSPKQTLIIAPNPTSGIVNISASAEIKQLNIFSTTGKLVNKLFPATNQVTFNTGLPKGIYTIQAIFEKNIQNVKLVVE